MRYLWAGSSKHLQEFRKWSERWVPPLTSAEDYVKAEVSLLSACCLTDLMFPEFQEVANGVFRGPVTDVDQVLNYMGAHPDSDNGGVREAEVVFNRIHLWDVFETRDDSAEDVALTVLAARMAVTWKLSAEAKFPGRKFEAVQSDEYGPTLTIVQV